jgi:hypothetical protein
MQARQRDDGEQRAVRTSQDGAIVTAPRRSDRFSLLLGLARALAVKLRLAALALDPRLEIVGEPRMICGSLAMPDRRRLEILDGHDVGFGHLAVPRGDGPKLVAQDVPLVPTGGKPPEREPREGEERQERDDDDGDEELHVDGGYPAQRRFSPDALPPRWDGSQSLQPHLTRHAAPAFHST